MLKKLEALHKRELDIAFNFKHSGMETPQRARITCVDHENSTVSLAVEFGRSTIPLTVPVADVTYAKAWQEQPEPEVELVLEPATAAA